jgi:hypothetical protein
VAAGFESATPLATAWQSLYPTLLMQCDLFIIRFGGTDNGQVLKQSIITQRELFQVRRAGMRQAVQRAEQFSIGKSLQRSVSCSARRYSHRTSVRVSPVTGLQSE